MDGESPFLLNCTPDGGCYCNWRYTITGCFYEADYKIINIVCLVTVLLAGCVSGVLLYFRLARLGHTIYGRDEQGKIFPRMTESVALAVFFFCIAKTIHCIVLHVDAYPNVAFRICLFNIVYAVGVVGIVKIVID
ncbi:hypothetical protein BC940DRAFT_3185 [Gongronella butleri]|nr:hypothetical protein BC940DRAFT_3185 [Gongronella butleri]